MIISNFIQIINEFESIPIKILLEPLLKQISYMESKSTN